MNDFWLDCCFDAVFEGIMVRKSTPGYADSAESQLPAMPHSTEFLSTFFTMTPRYVVQRRVDFALCGIPTLYYAALHGVVVEHVLFHLILCNENCCKYE
jgi:hypothetical protein